MTTFIHMIEHSDGYNGSRITGALCWDKDRHVMVYSFGFMDVSKTRVLDMLDDVQGAHNVESHVYPN